MQNELTITQENNLLASTEKLVKSGWHALEVENSITNSLKILRHSPFHTC